MYDVDMTTAIECGPCSEGLCRHCILDRNPERTIDSGVGWMVQHTNCGNETLYRCNCVCRINAMEYDPTESYIHT